jgi:rRNA processing protein Gar1
LFIISKISFLELGNFTHTCENDIVCITTCGKIPYFNAPVFFENKEQIGKIDEIFGGPKDNVSKKTTYTKTYAVVLN